MSDNSHLEHEFVKYYVIFWIFILIIIIIFFVLFYDIKSGDRNIKKNNINTYKLKINSNDR